MAGQIQTKLSHISFALILLASLAYAAETCEVSGQYGSISVYPCIAEDIDGKGITQYVNFTWAPDKPAANLDFYFSYPLALENGKVHRYNIQIVEKIREQAHLISNVASFETTGGPCEVGAEGSAYKYLLNISDGNGTITNQITACFDDYDDLGAGDYRIYYSETYNETSEWQDITPLFSYVGEYYGKHWYKVNNVHFEPGQSYATKWVYDVPQGVKSGKWGALIKLNSDTLQEALDNDRYIYLDPWWDSNWQNYVQVQFVCAEPGCDDGIATPVFLNSSDFNISGVAAGGADLRYVVNCSGVNAERPLWIADFNTGTNVSLFINYTNDTTCEHYIYFNNTGASTASSPYEVFEYWDSFNSYNGTAWNNVLGDSDPDCGGGFCEFNNTKPARGVYRANAVSTPYTYFVEHMQTSGNSTPYLFGMNWSAGNCYYSYNVQDTVYGGYAANHVSNRTYSTSLNSRALATTADIHYLYRFSVREDYMNLSRQVVQSGELNDNSWMLVHNDSYTGMEATAAIQPYPAYVGVALPTILRTYWYGGTNGTRIPTIDFFYEKHQYNASSPLINISLVNFATSTNISNFCLDIANETVNYTQCNLNAGHIVYSDTSYVPEGHCNLTIWKQNVAYNLTTATLDNSTLTNVSAYAWPYQNFNASNATGGAALSEFNITFVNNATLGSFFGNTTNGSIQIELVNFSDNNYGLYDLYASAPNFPSAHIQYNFTSSSLYYIDCVFQPLPEIVACTGSEPIILNFTYFNETSLEPINQTQEITITIWDASREASANYSFNLSSPSENHTLCINPANASNYYIDTFQTYGLPNGTTNERNYFMYNAPMGNTTEFIQLYNLPSSKTYLVRVWVRDNAGVGTGNVFVSFMRFYPASNQYRTVAMAKTDSQGYSNAYLAINDPHYRIIVYSGSTVLQSFEPQKVSCDVSVYSVCDLTLQIEREGGISWEVNNNFAHNCQYVNGSTDYVICTYTDLTGKMNKVSLSCFRQGLLAESSICAESNTSSSGVLVCDLTNETGQYICYLNVKFGTNSSYWLAETLGVGYTNPPIFGVDGLMVSIMLLMVMAAAGVWSVPVSIAFGLFGLIAAVYMGSIVLGATALSGIVIVGVVVAYLSRKSYG